MMWTWNLRKKGSSFSQVRRRKPQGFRPLFRLQRNLCTQNWNIMF